MRVSTKLFLTLFLLYSVSITEVPASHMTNDASHTVAHCSGISATSIISTDKNSLTNKTSSSNKKTQNSSPLIALTFDDGPSNRITDRILDILEENNSRATFFVIGTNIEKNSEVLVRAYSLGCEIGNHTYSHKNLTKLSKSDIDSEISSTNDAIFDFLLEDPKYLRVPACFYNKAVKAYVKMPIVLWSIDTHDWRYGLNKNKNTEANQQKIINEVLNKAKDGDIILMHDIYSITADACEVIIPKLCEMGFKLVTVSELFNAKGIKPENGNIYYKAVKSK